MADWFRFYLYVIQDIVSLVIDNFSLGDLGFTLGDVEIALLLIGLIASAFVAKFSNSLSGEVLGAKSYTEKLDREWDKKAHPALRGHRRDINRNI